MKNNCVYLITALEKLEDFDEYGYLNTGCRRSVGIIPTLEEATEKVLNNYLDIWETCYDYAVIERIYFGYYPTVEEEDRWYYKYNSDTGCYEQITDILPSYKNYCLPLGEIG